MTLFGITDWSDGDKAEWESVTAIYQESYYADTEDTGVIDFSTTLTVTDSRRFRHRRRLQDAEDFEEEESITLTFNQQLSYRLANANFTTTDVASLPFGTSEQRNQYVALFLNSVGGGSALVDVTGVSAVDGGEIIDPVPPTEAPLDQPTGEGSEVENEASEKSSISTGGVIGIVAASLFVCLGVCLVCNCQGGNEDDDYEDDENPYIPPSPDAFAANNKPIEHAYIDE